MEEEIFEVDVAGDFKEKATFPGLCGCLAVVHVSKDGAEAWHVSGMDLSMKLNQEHRRMWLMTDSGESAIESCDGRFEDWFDIVDENPGVTYLCGPNADRVAREFFNVEEENCLRTKEGPVDVMFDLKELKFYVL